MKQINWTVEKTFINIIQEEFASNLHIICNLYLDYADMTMKNVFISP